MKMRMKTMPGKFEEEETKKGLLVEAGLECNEWIWR